MIESGTRIRLIKMGNDPDPVPPGSTGTVERVSVLGSEQIISMTWDNGRTLNLIEGEDIYEVVDGS